MIEHSGVVGLVRQPWHLNRYQLISWWRVEEFSAASFCEIAKGLGSLHPKIENAGLLAGASPELLNALNSTFDGANGDTEEQRKITREWLDVICESCISIGLEVTASMAGELRSRLQAGLSYREQFNSFGAIEETFKHEMATRTFMYMPSDYAKYYAQVAAFGEKVEDRFFPASFDIKEAGNCLDTARSTAVVFHLMRVMEVGLKAFAHKLGIPYAPSWESYLKQINRKLAEDWSDKSPEWRKDEPFMRSIAGDIVTIKHAWRNPTMHVVNVYTQEEAALIFASVKSFMNRLADNNMSALTPEQLQDRSEGLR